MSVVQQLFGHELRYIEMAKKNKQEKVVSKKAQKVIQELKDKYDKILSE